ncbi:hypothetical protein N182_18330 [Sinorhizobium sp. GL2]|nr:hypothetical protein N182_18330 [Sinorhizobium sp. GL2]
MTDLTEAQQQAQAALEKVMNCRFSNFDAGAVIHWAERGFYQVKAEAASRISQQDAELERMRREVAEVREKLKDPAAVRINYLRGDIACQPLIDEARKAAFIDAAEIAEKLGSDEDEEWRSDCGGTVETRLAGARSWAFGRMRDLLFAKSEETGRG